MYKVFWSRRAIAFGGFAVLGVAALFSMAAIAAAAKRFDLMWMCNGLVVVFLVLMTGVAYLLGIMKIPTFSSDGESWVQASAHGRHISATPANLVEVAQIGPVLRITTTEGQIEVTPDCSGYNEIAALVKTWKARPSPPASRGTKQ